MLGEKRKKRRNTSQYRPNEVREPSLNYELSNIFDRFKKYSLSCENQSLEVADKTRIPVAWLLYEILDIWPY